MRILRVIPTLNPDAGGPREGLLRASDALLDHGVQTTIATFDRSGDPWLSAPPHRTLGFGPGRTAYHVGSPLARALPGLAAEADVVIAHGIWMSHLAAARHAAQKAGKPFVVYIHGMLAPWFRKAKPVKHWVKQAVYLGIEGPALAAADRVLFTSAAEMEEATGGFLGPAWRGEVVAYGAGTPEEPDRVAFAEAAPGLGDAPYLMFLGRLHPIKGCDTLVEAFASAAPPDVHLVIAGPNERALADPLRAQARALGVADRVHLTGPLRGGGKWAALRGALALCLLSHQESFGIVVAEALSVGRPALISTGVNIWREVTEAGAGLAAAPTAEAATGMLRQFFAMDAPERARMQQNAADLYAHRYTIQAACADLLRIIDEVQAERGAG